MRMFRDAQHLLIEIDCNDFIEPTTERQSYLSCTAATIQQSPATVQSVFIYNPVEGFLRIGNAVALIIFGRSEEEIVRWFCTIIFF